MCFVEKQIQYTSYGFEIYHDYCLEKIYKMKSLSNEKKLNSK